jgi:hypothetical protein
VLAQHPSSAWLEPPIQGVAHISLNGRILPSIELSLLAFIQVDMLTPSSSHINKQQTQHAFVSHVAHF